MNHMIALAIGAFRHASMNVNRLESPIPNRPAIFEEYFKP